jgi:hypothetical protein
MSHVAWYFISAIIVATVLLVTPVGAVRRDGTSSSFSDSPYYPVPYDSASSMTSLILSAAAYCPDAVVRTFSCSLCTNPLVSRFTVVDTVANQTHNIYGFVGFIEPDQASKTVSVFAAFRGTDSLYDWLFADFDVVQRPYHPELAPSMYVHEGFYEAYMSIHAQIRDLVQYVRDRYDTKELDLTCTGHSLGGAISVIACAELTVALGLKQKAMVVNFGQPRVGNDNFARFSTDFFRAFYRAIHWKDLVPHVPFSFDGEFGYLHGGQEMWYSEDSSSFLQCAVGEDPMCSDQDADLSIKDHLYYLGVHVAGGDVCTTQERISYDASFA